MEMLSVVRKRFTFANVAMTLALVFAMTGGAYAAGKYLITSTKQISPKVLKALAGKVGPAGPEGKAGAQGSNGKDGAQGLPGKDGTNGTNGKDGVSVTGSVETPGVNCKAGGSKFVAASGTTYACNGENGQTGFTATLPKNKTETGVWSGTANELSQGSEQFTSIGFSIPVQPAPTFVYVADDATTGDAGTAAGCPGVSGGMPEAEPGKFCIYTVGLEAGPGLIVPGATATALDPTSNFPAGPGVSPAGAYVKLTCPSSAFGVCTTHGLWAVTGS
jgi:hypothetical protein